MPASTGSDQTGRTLPKVGAANSSRSERDEIGLPYWSTRRGVAISQTSFI